MIDPELEEARQKWEEHFSPGITLKRLVAKEYQDSIKKELQRIEDQINYLQGYLPPEKEPKENWLQKFWNWSKKLDNQ